MALVKFVANRNCQVFVDMELAGKVTSQSMLKVTLETGGYLIQIKDEDDNLIKEYDLEIKSSDNQLLQIIEEDNNKLEDIIENLKNDSSLVFHCNRASFCHRGLYGFVDKKLNVVIPPIYFSVNEFVDDKAFVVRDFPEGRKTTMIDIDGNLFFNRWFDYIGESDDTILLGIDNRIIVYSKAKYNKIAEYFNAGYDYKYPVIPVFKKVEHDELYGFINYKGEEVVPLLFDKVDNFDNKGNAVVYFWGIKSEIEMKTFSLVDNIGDKYEIRTFEDLVRIFNDKGFFDEGDRIPIYENDSYIYKTIRPLVVNGKWFLQIITKFKNDNTSSEITIKCDKIVYLGNRCYVYRIGQQCHACFLDSKEDIVIDAEYIIPANRCVRGSGCAYDEYYPDTFITRKYGKYGTIDKNGKEILSQIYNSIIPIQPNYFIDIYTNLPVYAILQRGCHYSLANLSVGKIILPFEYDEILLFRNKWDSRKTIFKLHQGNKYMLFCIENELLTIKFDDITICDENSIVRIGNNYGVVDDYGKEIIPIKYDEISVLCSGLWVFVVKIGGKYGCVNEEAEIIVPIEYDKIEANSNHWTPWDDEYIVYLYEGDNAIIMDLKTSRIIS